MKKNLLLTLIFTLAIFTASYAQNYSFRILGTKGENTVDGEKMRIGSTVKSDQSIVMASNGYLGLAHTSGKTMELKEAGTYKVADLEAKMTKNNSDNSSASKYAAFVYQELTGNATASTSKRVKTGSVTRATPSSKSIRFMMPKSTPVFDGSNLTIKWYAAPGSELAEAPADVTYTITLMNQFREIIAKEETTDTHYTLDLTSDTFESQKNIMYLVEANGMENTSSDEYMLVRLKEDKSEKISAEMAEFTKDESALNNIIMARMFEENKLFANAINAYEQALALEDVEQFKALYNSFLERNGLVEVEVQNN